MNTVGSSERVFPQARAQDDITVSHFDFNRWLSGWVAGIGAYIVVAVLVVALRLVAVAVLVVALHVVAVRLVDVAVAVLVVDLRVVVVRLVSVVVAVVNCGSLLKQ